MCEDQETSKEQAAPQTAGSVAGNNGVARSRSCLGAVLLSRQELHPQRYLLQALKPGCALRVAQAQLVTPAQATRGRSDPQLLFDYRCYLPGGRENMGTDYSPQVGGAAASRRQRGLELGTLPGKAALELGLGA